jgi:hypothetical protein
LIDIREYIKLPKEERQKHLKLDEPCIERGFGSFELRGLLGHIFDTTSPWRVKPKICVCHACNNEKCGNPNHLYWGTNQENIHDSIKAGTFIQSTKGKKRKPLSDETKAKISKARKGKPSNNNNGRNQYGQYSGLG